MEAGKCVAEVTEEGEVLQPNCKKRFEPVLPPVVKSCVRRVTL